MIPTKKGEQSTTILVIFVLVILVIIVSVGIMIALRQVIDENVERGYCSAQIKAHSIAVGISNELAAPSINCPTNVVDATVKTTDQTNAILAHEMKRCWDQWGNGDLELFGQEEKIYCHLCSMVRLKGQEQVVGLPAYLESHDAVKGVRFNKYLETKRQGAYYSDGKIDGSLATFDATKPIGVIFVYAKGREWYKQVYNDIIGQPAVGMAAGGTVGVVILTYVPAGVVTSGVVILSGAIAGTGTSFFSRTDPSILTGVVVRPIDETSIQSLGCQYAPTG